MIRPRQSRSRSLPVLETPAEARLHAWLELARVAARVERRVTVAIASAGLTLPQFDVLATLRFSEGVTQQELAGRLLVTKGNVCGVLDRLERVGWVERRDDPRDRRVRRLHLTPAGRRRIDATLPTHDVTVLAAMQRLSGAEVAMLRSLLGRLDETLADPSESSNTA